MRILLTTVALMAVLPTWAVEPVYKGYPGPERPDSDLATLQVPGEGWVAIREGDPASKGLVRVLASSYQLVKVLPGEQDIKWGWASRRFGTCARETVTLEAGHFYVLGVEPNQMGRGPLPATTGMWLEDTTTNEIIAGRKPPDLLQPGQVNPPRTIRWLYDHPTNQFDERGMCYDECVSLDPVSKDPEVLKRREMITEIGDQTLPSPAGKSLMLRSNLTVLAARIEKLGAHSCADNSTTSKDCKYIRGYARDLERKFESHAKKGTLTEEDAADLISKVQALLSTFEERE